MAKSKGLIMIVIAFKSYVNSVYSICLNL